MTDLNSVIVEGRLTSGVGEKDFGYISTGTANVINESNSGDDYFYIVSKKNDQIIGELYILTNK